MADRSVTLKLSANVTGLVAGLKTGQKAFKDLSRGAKAFGPTASEGSEARAAFLSAGKAAHEAAASADLMYDSTGKLTDQFGRLVSETDAAKKGLKAVSDEARFSSEQSDAAASAMEEFGKARWSSAAHACRGCSGGEGLFGVRFGDV